MMDRDRLDYFFLSLDAYLSEGVSPAGALEKTVEDYAYVYFTDDGRLPLSRAAEIELKKMNK